MKSVNGMNIAVVSHGNGKATIAAMLEQMGGKVIITHDSIADIETLDGIDCLVVESSQPPLPALLPIADRG